MMEFTENQVPIPRCHCILNLELKVASGMFSLAGSTVQNAFVIISCSIRKTCDGDEDDIGDVQNAGIIFMGDISSHNL